MNAPFDPRVCRLRMTGPAEYEQASERHEPGKRQMQDYDKVREQGAHRSIVLSCGRNLLSCRSHDRCP